MEIVINLIVAVLILGMTYALASEGLWGAALMFFNVLFGGLIAFNFYEPLAKLLADNVPLLSGFADTVCLMLLFIVATFILRLTTETLAPAMVRFPAPLYHLGRFVFALGCSLDDDGDPAAAFETAPVHKKIFGVIDYKTLPLRTGARPRVAGVLPVHDRPGLRRLTSPGTRDPFGRVRRRQGLRPPGRVAAEPPGRAALRHRVGPRAGRRRRRRGAGGGRTRRAAAASGRLPPAAGRQRRMPAIPRSSAPAVGGGVVMPQ